MIKQGDVMEQLATLPDESVHCVVTSPPYWGLRDYGVEEQIGLEPTIEEYVAKMVEVFQEVKRVLRKDGTLWLNMGDSYASQGGERVYGSSDDGTGRGAAPGPRINGAGLKPKDMCGIPWRVAFALQADGWWLRSDIIWHKPNPMPGSQQDRPTSAHEYIFLLSKSARYFYDAEAVRVPAAAATVKDPRTADQGNRKDRGYPGAPSRGSTNLGRKQDGTGNPTYDGFNDRYEPQLKASLRDVWTIATQPYPDAHFATFPARIPELAILAGTSKKGICPECGAPWEREIDKEFIPQLDVSEGKGIRGANAQKPMAENNNFDGSPRGSNQVNTTGWRPTCEHEEWSCPTCSLVLNSEHETLSPNVPAVRSDISTKEKDEEVLLPGMLHTGEQETPRQNVRAVRQDIPSKRSSNPLLQQVLFDKTYGAEPPQQPGMVQDSAGLHSGLSPRPLEGQQSGIHNAAPANDGRDFRESLEAVGDSASSKRDQGRQPPRELTDDDEAPARQTPKGNLDSDLPGLQASIPAKGECPRCGAALILQPHKPIPATVLDCFIGSGTTGQVATRLGRDWIGIELNPDYIPMIKQRTATTLGMNLAR